jgi:hypothetical protein
MTAAGLSRGAFQPRHHLEAPRSTHSRVACRHAAKRPAPGVPAKSLGRPTRSRSRTRLVATARKLGGVAAARKSKGQIVAVRIDSCDLPNNPAPPVARCAPQIDPYVRRRLIEGIVAEREHEDVVVRIEALIRSAWSRWNAGERVQLDVLILQAHNRTS